MEREEKLRLIEAGLDSRNDSGIYVTWSEPGGTT